MLLSYLYLSIILNWIYLVLPPHHLDLYIRQSRLLLCFLVPPILLQRAHWTRNNLSNTKIFAQLPFLSAWQALNGPKLMDQNLWIFLELTFFIISSGYFCWMCFFFSVLFPTCYFSSLNIFGRVHFLTIICCYHSFKISTQSIMRQKIRTYLDLFDQDLVKASLYREMASWILFFLFNKLLILSVTLMAVSVSRFDSRELPVESLAPVGLKINSGALLIINGLRTGYRILWGIGLIWPWIVSWLFIVGSISTSLKNSLGQLNCTTRGKGHIDLTTCIPRKRAKTELTNSIFKKKVMK